jgi:hypothetical protein
MEKHRGDLRGKFMTDKGRVSPRQSAPDGPEVGFSLSQLLLNVFH